MTTLIDVWATSSVPWLTSHPASYQSPCWGYQCLFPNLQWWEVGTPWACCSGHSQMDPAEGPAPHPHPSSPGTAPVCRGSQYPRSSPLLKENILLDHFLTKALLRKRLFWSGLAIYSMEKGSLSNRWLRGRISQIQSFENSPEIRRRGVQWTSPKLFRLPLAEKGVVI